jgi:hypothetical protein
VKEQSINLRDYRAATAAAWLEFVLFRHTTWMTGALRPHRNKLEGVGDLAKDFDTGVGREHIMNDAVGGNADGPNDLTALSTSRRDALRRSSGFVRRSAMRARRQGHGRVAIVDVERLGLAPFGDCAFDDGGCAHTKEHGVRMSVRVYVAALGRGSFAGQGFSPLKAARFV